MTVVGEAAVRELLESRHATVLRAEPIDDGPVRALRYYVAPTAT
jgi:hypothetical protein